MKLKRDELKKILGSKIVFFEENRYLIATRNNYKLDDERFELFDEKNEQVFVDDNKLLLYRSECHGKDRFRGFFHKGSNILIENKGKIFFQKRSKEKDLFGGKYDFSVGEHVKIGESFEEAAIRGAKEELGIEIKKKDLKLLYKSNINHKFNQEFCAYFLLKINDVNFEFSSEIDGGEWISIEKLKDKDFMKRFNFREDHKERLKEILFSTLKN